MKLYEVSKSYNIFRFIVLLLLSLLVIEMIPILVEMDPFFVYFSLPMVFILANAWYEHLNTPLSAQLDEDEVTATYLFKRKISFKTSEILAIKDKIFPDKMIKIVTKDKTILLLDSKLFISKEKIYSLLKPLALKREFTDFVLGNTIIIRNFLFRIIFLFLSPWFLYMDITRSDYILTTFTIFVIGFIVYDCYLLILAPRRISISSDSLIVKNISGSKKIPIAQIKSIKRGLFTARFITLRHENGRFFLLLKPRRLENIFASSIVQKNSNVQIRGLRLKILTSV